jgi:threonine dehydratase
MHPDSFTVDALARSVEHAAKRIAPWIRHTPLERSGYLSALAGAEVFMKLENFQVTASFKARGAFNALLSLSPEQRARGVVTSSTGNHANAMAHAMPLLGVEGEIWVPESVSPVKRTQLEMRGARLRLLGGDPGEVEGLARREAEASGRHYVSPYNDPDVVAGQGTIAREILADLPEFDEILVPVGGGGLIAGIAGYLKAQRPGVRVTGVLPENSPVISESVKAGRLLEIPWTESLSDATVGWAEPGSITFPMCRDWVDDWILVSEARIREAIRMNIDMHSMLVEGAAGLAGGAILADPARFAGRRVVLLICGARIASTTLAKVLASK